MTRTPEIVGIGHHYPPREVANAHFATTLNLSDRWIVERTGIRTRRIVADCEATSDLIVPAARECLRSAGRTPDDVDCILVATVTPDHAFPSTAAIVQGRLGARRAWALDLSASSSGFVFALGVARSLILAGTASSVLVCGADKMSSVTDPEDATTAILFGDGAGVVLVEPGDEEFGIVDVVLRSDVTSTLMGRHNLTVDDVAWLVAHQANRRIMDAVAQHLAFPVERTMSNIECTGNTLAASIPGCLSVWHQEGRLRRGDRLLLTSFGSGYTAGAAYPWSL